MTLVFIDTNIVLDFYRMGGEAAERQLKLIDTNQEIIITSSQMEMEYKKNRQSVILETIAQISKIDNSNISLPPVLVDAQPAKMIKKSSEELNKQKKRIMKRIERILNTPNYNDSVYKTMQRLFKRKGPYNLQRNDNKRFAIRKLAWQRFILGYPPRKPRETSLGDAFNWEWIMHCAKESGRNVVIATRDNDYGIAYRNESILNDWLAQEFKQRVGKKEIKLTNALTKAFKMANKQVSDKDQKAEKEFLNKRVAEWAEFAGTLSGTLSDSSSASAAIIQAQQTLRDHRALASATGSLSGGPEISEWLRKSIIGFDK